VFILLAQPTADTVSIKRFVPVMVWWLTARFVACSWEVQCSKIRRGAKYRD
jgi:hypothetical protein